MVLHVAAPTVLKSESQPAYWRNYSREGMKRSAGPPSLGHSKMVCNKYCTEYLLANAAEFRRRRIACKMESPS